MPYPRLIAALIALAIAAGSAWYVRGMIADKAMSDFKDGLRAQQDDQRALKAKVEAADTQNTAASTARIDTAVAEQQKEIQYVDREVIRYVRNPDAGRCVLPTDWVRLYNQTGGLPGGVPETSPAGPATDGTGRVAAGAALPGN
jgi:hypothetical protein